MGFYINPRDVSKEHWCDSNGAIIDQSMALATLYTKTHAPVCLVNNGPFNAAGICYSKDEVVAFSLPDDNRPKLWFAVERKRLIDAGFIPASAFEE